MTSNENRPIFKQQLPPREQIINIPKAAAVAIINDKGEILLGHRLPEDGDDWVYPGGAVDQGETFAIAAQREVMEETGIALDPERNKLFPLANYITTPSAYGVRHDLLVYATRYHNDQPQPQVASPNEISEWGWFSPQVAIDRAKSGEMKILPSGIFAIQRAKEYLSSEHIRDFGEVLMGGTFDRLHSGHQRLLRRAFEIGDYVYIGLTTDAYIQRSSKTLKEIVASYQERLYNLRKYLEEEGVLNRVVILPLEDAAGPKALDPKLEAIIVSEDTQNGGAYVNELRAKFGVTPMDTIIVPLLKDTEGVISSSRLRQGTLSTGQTQEP